MWPKADHWGPGTSTSNMMVKKDNMVMSSVIMGMSKTAYKTRRMESSSIDTSLYVNTPGITQCPHCQTSFCPPLKISFQYHFPMSENISHGLISFSNPGGRHFIKVTHMRTYLVSGVRPPHLAYQRYYFSSSYEYQWLVRWCRGHFSGERLGNRTIWT